MTFYEFPSKKKKNKIFIYCKNKFLWTLERMIICINGNTQRMVAINSKKNLNSFFS